MKLRLNSWIIEIESNSIIIRTASWLLICFTIHFLIKRSIPESTSWFAINWFMSIADADAGVWIDSLYWFICQSIADGTGNIIIVWLVIFTLWDKGQYLRTVEIMFGVIGVPSLSSPMQFGVHDPVANHYSFKIDCSWWNNWVFILNDFLRKQRDVHSAIRLSWNPKFVFRKLRE